MQDPLVEYLILEFIDYIKPNRRDEWANWTRLNIDISKLLVPILPWLYSNDMKEAAIEFKKIDKNRQSELLDLIRYYSINGDKFYKVVVPLKKRIVLSTLNIINNLKSKEKKDTKQLKK